MSKSPDSLVNEARLLLTEAFCAEGGARTSKVQAAVNRLNQHPQVRIAPDLANLPLVRVMVNMAKEISVGGKKTKAEAVFFALDSLGALS